GRNVVDRTSCCIVAEQDALRALQHFDSLEIEESQCRECGKRQGCLVEIDADRRIRGERSIVKANAAQSIDRRGLLCLRVAQPRHLARQVLKRGYVLLLERVSTQR